MESQPHLALQSLSKSFDSRLVLKDIDLNIKRGEFVSLLGPSGCGKTTTLRCIAGFEFPDSGTVLFGNEDITLRDPAERNFGMVFQSYALFPHMTVNENVSFGLEMRGVSKAERNQRVAKMLELVQLKGKEDSFPRQLSGGQQQRVALARAIAFEPDVLLLDEPLANLDAVLRDEMRYFIRGVQKQLNLTAVYVTHDQAEAMSMSDQIVVMFDGEIVQKGSPEAIYGSPVSRRVAAFIGRGNFLEGSIREKTGPGRYVVATQAGNIFASGDDDLDVNAKVTVLVRPENITTAPLDGSGGQSKRPGADDENVLDIEIVNSVYHGAQWEITGQTKEGSSLLTSISPDIMASIKKHASLSFKAAHSRILTQ